MKIYIASASAEPHLEAVEGLMHVVLRMKHEITFDWTVPVRKNKGGSPPDLGIRLQSTINDLAAIRHADLVWLVAPPLESRSTGAWVELGYALALGVPVITSGDVSRCIFADLACATFETHEDALDWLREAQ